MLFKLMLSWGLTWPDEWKAESFHSAFSAEENAQKKRLDYF